MKIIIVDDEPIAVESLVYMVNKNFDNLDIVGTARTGKDAVELAIKLHPNIIIMDINMPGLNGLEAIKKIRSFNSSTSFLVITAYDYFDYAVESVSLGVEEYLLKPVKESIFVETLNLIMSRVKQRSEKMQELLEQQEKIKLSTPAIEASFIYSLCTFGESKGVLKKYSTLLGFNDIGGYVIILEFSNKEDQIDAHILVENLYDEYRSILKSSCSCIVGPIMANQIIVYIFDEAIRNSYEQKTSSIRLARRILRRILNTHSGICIGIGRHYNSVENAKSSYSQANNALLSLHNMQNNVEDDTVFSHIIHEDDVRETQEVVGTDFDNLIDEELFSNIPHEKETYVEMKFDEIFLKLASNDNLSLNILKNYMISIIVGFAKRWEAVINDYYSVLSLIIQTSSKNELHRICKQFLNNALADIYNSQKQKANAIIEKANNYIEAYYPNSISLESVAREVNLSSYYFSRFYKEETGINFSDKLSNVRIEKAKELLTSGNLSIKDVSYKVGFTDPNYFSKAFKKITGVTASDYRKTEKV